MARAWPEDMAHLHHDIPDCQVGFMSHIAGIACAACGTWVRGSVREELTRLIECGTAEHKLPWSRSRLGTLEQGEPSGDRPGLPTSGSRADQGSKDYGESQTSEHGDSGQRDASVFSNKHTDPGFWAALIFVIRLRLMNATIDRSFY